MRVINEYLEKQEEENTSLTHLSKERTAAWCARAGLRFEGGTGKTGFTLLAASANVQNQSWPVSTSRQKKKADFHGAWRALKPVSRILETVFATHTGASDAWKLKSRLIT